MDTEGDIEESNEYLSATPINIILSCLEDSRALSESVRILAEYLIGSEPGGGISGEGQKVGGGIISSLAETARYTAADIRKAQYDIDRILYTLGLESYFQK